MLATLSLALALSSAPAYAADVVPLPAAIPTAADLRAASYGPDPWMEGREAGEARARQESVLTPALIGAAAGCVSPVCLGVFSAAAPAVVYLVVDPKLPPAALAGGDPAWVAGFRDGYTDTARKRRASAACLGGGAGFALGAGALVVGYLGVVGFAVAAPTF